MHSNGPSSRRTKEPLSSRGPGFKSLTEHFSEEQRDEERAERRGFETGSEQSERLRFKSLTEHFFAERSSKRPLCVSLRLWSRNATRELELASTVLRVEFNSPPDHPILPQSAIALVSHQVASPDSRGTVGAAAGGGVHESPAELTVERWARSGVTGRETLITHLPFNISCPRTWNSSSMAHLDRSGSHSSLS
jgi:hypothetical protein